MMLVEVCWTRSLPRQGRREFYLWDIHRVSCHSEKNGRESEVYFHVAEGKEVQIQVIKNDIAHLKFYPVNPWVFSTIHLTSLLSSEMPYFPNSLFLICKMAPAGSCIKHRVQVFCTNCPPAGFMEGLPKLHVGLLVMALGSLGDPYSPASLVSAHSCYASNNLDFFLGICCSFHRWCRFFLALLLPKALFLVCYSALSKWHC